jgi:hypothetical protein
MFRARVLGQRLSQKLTQFEQAMGELDQKVNHDEETYAMQTPNYTE